MVLHIFWSILVSFKVLLLDCLPLLRDKLCINSDFGKFYIKFQAQPMPKLDFTAKKLKWFKFYVGQNNFQCAIPSSKWSIARWTILWMPWRAPIIPCIPLPRRIKKISTIYFVFILTPYSNPIWDIWTFCRRHGDSVKARIFTYLFIYIVHWT